MNTVSKLCKSISSYLEKNKNYFLNGGYEISIFINTKQTEYFYLTNRPIFKEEKGLSNGLKHADIEVNGDILLLKEFNYLETMLLCMETYSDLSVLKNFTNLKYIAFDENLNQEHIDAVHKILPECIVKDYLDIHPSWREKF